MSEADAANRDEFIDVGVDVTSLRTSEVSYLVGVRTVTNDQPSIKSITVINV